MDSNTGSLLQEVLKRLDALGAKLGSGAQIGWELMVRKVFWYDGVLMTGLFSVLLILAITLTIVLVRKAHADVKGTRDSGMEFAIGAIGALISGGLLLALVEHIAAILVPEFYAVEQLIQMFR